VRITDVKEKRQKVKHNEMAWNRVISDAESKLRSSVTRTQRLREIVADLKRMKDSGEPWPTAQLNGHKSESATQC